MHPLPLASLSRSPPTIRLPLPPSPKHHTDTLPAAWRAVFVGYLCSTSHHACPLRPLLLSPTPSVEKKQPVPALLVPAHKLLAQQQLDRRLVKLLHVENPALLLVNVRNINHHSLQVCR